MQESTELSIGNGAFGYVFKDTWGNMPDAIKSLSHYPETMPIAIKRPSEKADSLEALMREIAIHRTLNHPNIVAYLGELEATITGNIGLIMELVSGGDLLEIRNKRRGPFSGVLQLSIARDIALGLHYLHELKIIHRDLKCENVLIEYRGQSVIAKICDFGLAISMEAQPFTARVGSPHYMAPELTSMQSPYPFSVKSDIYAYSIILWLLTSKRYPYEKSRSLSINEIFNLVSRGKRDTIPAHTHIDYGKLITDCWEQNPELRPLSAEIITRLNDTLTLISNIHQLIKNPTDITETKKVELLDKIKLNPSCLTWSFDDNGDPLLHYMIAKNNLFLINALSEHPQWSIISQTKNLITNKSAFNQIAALGQMTYYEILKPPLTDQTTWIFALLLAVNKGHEEFCKKLLIDGVNPDAPGIKIRPLILAASKGFFSICKMLLESGANPTFKNERGQTAEECWIGPPHTNPFQLFREQVSLSNHVEDRSETERTDASLALIEFGIFTKLTLESARIERSASYDANKKL